jgi:hypothetical protein
MFYHQAQENAIYKVYNCVVKLAEALCYKSEGHGFNSQ